MLVFVPRAALYRADGVTCGTIDECAANFHYTDNNTKAVSIRLADANRAGVARSIAVSRAGISSIDDFGYVDEYSRRNSRDVRAVSTVSI